MNSTGLTIAGPSAFAGFEMRNFSDTIGTLLGNGTVGLGSATLTVGAGNFSGVIQQGTIGAATGGRLTKNTAGTLTLTGANTYTGTTTLSAGVLNLGSAEIAGVSGPLGRSAAANPGSIVFGGGVLQYSAANQNDYSGRFSKTIGQAYKVDTNSQNVTFATALTSLIGTLTKSGNGTLSLAAANTYSGTTTVSAGTLLVAGGIKSTVINVTGGSLVAGNATALVAGAAVAVAMGAGFEYHAVANAPLTIGALTLNSGAGTTIGGSLGSTLTGAEIVVTGNVNPTPGAIKVNVSAIPGVTTGATGTYTLLTAGAGSTLNIGTTYTLGTVAVFNNTNFTVGSPAATATTITVDIVAATPLTAAYWKGGLAGNPSVWSASNGSTASNWATNAAGTATPLVPGAGTDVFFSSTGATDPGSMTLGANMAIASLTINAATAPEVRAVKLNNDGFTLTLAGAGGITINAGAGALSLLPDLILGSSQTWTNNSGNLFTTGKVTNGASTLTVAGSSDTRITGALGSGAGGLIKTGNSTLTLTQNNPYTGGTQLLQGALVFNPTAGVPVANPFGTGTLTLAGGTRLSVAVDAQTVPNALSFIDPVSAVTIEAQTHVNFSGNGDFNGGTRTINGTVNASEIAFSGVLSNGGVTFTTSGLPAPVGGVNPYVAFLYNGAAEHAYTGLTTVQNNAFLVLQTAGEKIRGDVLIQGNGVVDYLNAQFQTLNNQLADTATVTVNSPGSTISSPNGNLTYAGLELRNNSDTIGALFGSGAGIVGLGSGALTVGRGDFSGVIRDGAFGTGGTLTKNTTGTLTLRGANTYTGNTVINNGTLVLDGSVESPAVIVNFSGTLMGTGRAAHNVLNTGIFSPGNSAGTFRIGGNFVQTGAGATVIEIGGAGAGEHDLVAVGGTAFLDGTLRLVKLGNARLKVGDKVTFLTAGSGVTGQFVKVDNPFATGTISTGAVVYGPNEVSLQIRQGSFLTLGTIIPLTLNQRAVAKELDKVLAASSEKKLIAFLNGEPLGNLPRDFDLIAAEELQSLYSIGLSQANVQTANLQRRMDDVRAGRTGFSAEGLSVSGAGEQEHAAALPASPPLAGLNGPAGPGGKEMRAPADPRFGAFITGVGEFAHIGNTAGAKGYDLATGGFTLGVDYRLTPNFTVGVNTGYARSGADLINSGRVSVDGAKLGVYATYFDEGFYVDAAVQGGYNSYDTRRSALRGPASGSTTGGEVNALIAAGFDFTSDALRIGPTASFQYTHIGFSGFRESGSLAPLQFGGQATDSTRTAIGMKAAYEFRLASGVVVRPEARLAWQHEFADAAEAIDSRLANGGGSVFTVHGVEIGRDSALLGLGVAVLWNDRTSAYLYYDGEVGRSNYQSNNVSGGMRMAF